MSSTVSGTYSLVESLVDQLHASARAKVQQLRSELDRINTDALQERKAYEQRIAERDAREEERRNREDNIAKEAAYQEWLQNTQKVTKEKGSIVRLNETIAFLQQQEEQSVVVTELIGKLRQLQAAVSLFGINEQVEAEITKMIEKTVPDELEKERQEEIDYRHDLERFEHYSTVTGKRNEKTQKFVSLAGLVQQTRQEHNKTPWESFYERLFRIVDAQHSMGIYDNDADELAALAVSLPVSLQTRFIVQNEAALAEWEDELSRIETTRQSEKEQLQVAFDEYNALCVACSVPLEQRLTAQTDLITLHQASTELWKKLEALQERMYLEASFREVFEDNGMTFESMAVPEQNTVQLEFAIDDRASIRILRSQGGAFEMCFVGRKSGGAEASQSERREIMEKATSFCSLLPKLTAELAKRGIIFDQRSVQEPNEDTIILEADTNSNRLSDEQTEQILVMK